VARKRWQLSRIHRQQQPALLSARTLKRFEERLASFIRIRRDVLVNPLHITRIHKNSPLVVKLWLSDGTMLISSRRRKIEILGLLQQMNRAAPPELSS
jgi:DNA-binding LytR/AlgR family response regulator